MSSQPVTIVMVDDDALMRRSITFLLNQAGYSVSAFDSALPAIAFIEQQNADLVLLDIGLPGVDGLEALRRIQARADIPVIFVTARRRELEQVLGLELGADDYITKPFDPDILLARIRAVLRRTRRSDAAHAAETAEAQADAPVRVGDMMIHPAAHSVTRAGEPIALSPREFDLLLALAREPDRVLSTDDLIQRVWGDDFLGEPQIVYVHMRRLREKVEDDPAAPTRILTVRGVGYRFVAREPDDDPGLPITQAVDEHAHAGLADAPGD